MLCQCAFVGLLHSNVL